MKKLSLSKETLRDLTARPMSQEEVTKVGGGSTFPQCDTVYGACAGTLGHSCGACNGSFVECAGSTGCNSTTHACPER
jgi:hypothetical protein